MSEFQEILSHTWIVIADGGQARAWELQETRKHVFARNISRRTLTDEMQSMELVPADHAQWQAESTNAFEVSRHRGITRAGPGGGTPPYIDIRDEVKEDFMKTLAEKLEICCRNGAFQHLVVAAPAKMLGTLKQHLSKNLQHRLICTISKDLTHFAAPELLTHIKEDVLKALRTEAAAA